MAKFLFITILLSCFSLQAFSQSNSQEQMAMEYVRNGEVEKAIALYQEVFEKNPNPYVYKSFLTLLLEQKDYKEAEKLIKKNLKRNPEDPESKVDLGYVILLSGEKSKAEKYFQNSIIDKLPPNDYYVIQTAEAFVNRDLKKYAIQTFLTARKNAEDPHIYAMELAQIYDMEGKTSEMTLEYVNLLNNNDPLLPYIQNRLQASLATGDKKLKSEQIRKVLLQQVQNNPNSSSLQELLIWILLQEHQYDLLLTQVKAFEKRFNVNGSKMYEIANTLNIDHAYPQAKQAYQYLIDKGKMNIFYYRSKIGLLRAGYAEITESVSVDSTAIKTLEQQYEELIKEIPDDEQAAILKRELAHIYAFYSNNFTKAENLLNTAIASPRVSKNIIAECKLDLADILLFSGQVWEATLLYSQVEKDFKNDEIGFNAKLKNAKLYYYIGEFEWAVAQLDVLKAATSKLIANDAMELSLFIKENRDYDSSFSGLTLYAKADLRLYQNKPQEALSVLDTLMMQQFNHPLFDDILYKKAEIKIKEKKFEDADALLTKVYTEYAGELLADDALYLAAKINEENLNNLMKAMNLYEKIIIEYPSSLYVVDARRRFRALRGDLLN